MSGQWFLHSNGSVTDNGGCSICTSRPVVVIDPDDLEQVERLTAAITEHRAPGPNVHNVKAALREFANPTPPKPQEPTGLGAVVEDAAGELWVQTCHDVTNPWSHGSNGGRRQSRGWSEIAVVKVLSEGVTP